MTLERLEQIAALAKENKPVNVELVEILTDLFLSLHKHSTGLLGKISDLENTIKENNRKINLLDQRFNLMEKQSINPIYQLMVDENQEDRDELFDYLKFVISQSDDPVVNEVIQKVFRYFTDTPIEFETED